MKYIITCLLISVVIIFSCNNPGVISKMNSSALGLQQYTIRSDMDTIIKTANGALLNIPKGSLLPEEGNSVTLEIREAYSMEQMIQARLVTQSNGEPLSSGGMIYINAAAGQKVKITKAIRVAVPTSYLTKGMELYKGDTTKGGINWTNPVPLVENKQQVSIDTGQVLFQQLCSSCHKIGADFAGPDLAHFPKRKPFGDLSKYWYHSSNHDYSINNLESDSSRTMKDTAIYRGESIPDSLKPRPREKYALDIPVDSNELWTLLYLEAYKCNLRHLWFPVIGTDFPVLENQALQSIYHYIQNESDRKGLPFPGQTYLKDCLDSCKAYWKEVVRLENEGRKVAAQRQDLIKDNGSMTEKRNQQVIVAQPPTLFSNNPFTPDDDKVSQNDFSSEYYQFTIDTFGWYNIDILLKGINGVEESDLFVRIRGEYRERLNIYLIIPSMKVLVDGGPTGKTDEYAFYYKTGKIPLPQGAKAYILAVSERDEKLAFAFKEFTTSRQQEFEISLTSSTKEIFTSTMKQFSADSLVIKVNDSKNAGEIRKVDKQLKNINEKMNEAQKLKPKNCNCDCGGLH
jgi:hypothetical protein